MQRGQESPCRSMQIDANPCVGASGLAIRARAGTKVAPAMSRLTQLRGQPRAREPRSRALSRERGRSEKRQQLG